MSAARTGATVAALMLMLAGPALAQAKKPQPAPPPSATAASDSAIEPDLAFGAYQRGYFLTAFNEASRRAKNSDPKAMTLLGELYANGFGVGRDDAKAAQWYQRASDMGDREAMFALAIFRFEGRGGPRDTDQGARLFDAAAKLGHPAAAYDLGLLYLQGQQFPQDYKRAAELFDIGARAGNPESQYALATMYKEGRGVPKDEREAMRLMGQAALAGNVDAMVEFGIAQFNGSGTAKNEAEAIKLFFKAASRNSPIAQNRLARILSAGRGVPAIPVAAIKWHLIAKAGGAGDPELDLYVAKQKPEDRAAGEKAAQPGSQPRHRRALDLQLPSLQEVRWKAAQSAMRKRGGVFYANTLSAPTRSRRSRGQPPLAGGKGFMLHSALLNVMIAAARKAARALKRDFGELEKLQVSLKGPANFVTAADRRAEETLFQELTRARPGYGFLGEEGGHREGADKTHRWIVDPLDGTTNFLHGIPQFAISIALERDGT